MGSYSDLKRSIWSLYGSSHFSKYCTETNKPGYIQTWKKYSRMEKMISVLFQTFFFLTERESLPNSNLHSRVYLLPPTQQVQLNPSMTTNKPAVRHRRLLFSIIKLFFSIILCDLGAKVSQMKLGKWTNRLRVIYTGRKAGLSLWQGTTESNPNHGYGLVTCQRKVECRPANGLGGRKGTLSFWWFYSYCSKMVTLQTEECSANITNVTLCRHFTMILRYVKFISKLNLVLDRFWKPLNVNSLWFTEELVFVRAWLQFEWESALGKGQ